MSANTDTKNNRVATVIHSPVITIDPLHNTITYNRDYINKKITRYRNSSNNNADNVVEVNNDLNAKKTTVNDILDSVVSSCRKTIEDGYTKLLDSKDVDTTVADNVNSIAAFSFVKTKRRYITKDQVMDVWDLYLDDCSIYDIIEKTGLTEKEVSRIIVNQFRPVHPRNISKNYADEDIVQYNYIKGVYAEIIRRCKVQLYYQTKMLSEHRHFELGLPWSEALVTPLEYISTSKVLTNTFKEIAQQYKAAINNTKVSKKTLDKR